MFTPEKNIILNSLGVGLLLRGNFLSRIIVLELIMRGNSAACYVEKPRLRASGVKNDARKSHRNQFSAKFAPQNRFELVG